MIGIIRRTKIQQKYSELQPISAQFYDSRSGRAFLCYWDESNLGIDMACGAEKITKKMLCKIAEHLLALTRIVQ
jgi:hypothetical protein